jgi:hypothetical protein
MILKGNSQIALRSMGTYGEQTALDVLIGASPVALDRVAERLQENGAAKLGDNLISEILTSEAG